MGRVETGDVEAAADEDQAANVLLRETLGAQVTRVEVEQRGHLSAGAVSRKPDILRVAAKAAGIVAQPAKSLRNVGHVLRILHRGGARLIQAERGRDECKERQEHEGKVLQQVQVIVAKEDLVREPEHSANRSGRQEDQHGQSECNRGASGIKVDAGHCREAISGHGAHIAAAGEGAAHVSVAVHLVVVAAAALPGTAVNKQDDREL